MSNMAAGVEVSLKGSKCQDKENSSLRTMPSFTVSDYNEYTQIVRSSPVIVVVPVPMPRSMSLRKLQKPIQNMINLKDDIFSPETNEQRTKKRRSQSMDDIFSNSSMKTFGKFLEPPTGSTLQAMSDCVPSPSSGSSYVSSSGSNSSTDSSSSPSCEISILERLIRTHPVWFLPSLQRSGALHLLQGREVGNFIVRSSTHPLTMAVSVKLPGNLVEHYLLHAVDNQITLENSSHSFGTVHQLIAHYCTISDEIPVVLRVPTAIAEATTRQQLRSLALLGQEFWTHSASPNCGKELISPSDAEISKTFISTGLGSRSQSSSSQNSLCDSRKCVTLHEPCRPTTLELGSFVPSGVTVVTPPPVPPRWSRSTLLTPLSLPSSIQSTPSEIQSTFSEKGGRLVKKKKRNSGAGGKEPIHYKDTEILDIFKGTKTSYDDKASDYEDIWSPQYSSKSQTLSELPRLSTFKPDLIASSFGSDLDNLYRNNQKCQFQSFTAMSNNNEVQLNSTQANNSRNHRLSFNGNSQNNMQNKSQQEIVGNRQIVGGTDEIGTTTIAITPTTPCVKSILSKSKSSLYSEPVDSIVFRRFTNYRHSEPNIRWSQPAMMSLVNVDNHLPDIPQSPDHGVVVDGDEQEMKMRKSQSQQHQLQLRGSLVSVNNVLRHDEEIGKENTTRCIGKHKNETVTVVSSSIKLRNSQSQSITCVSVDNLCHLREIRKRTKNKLNCGGGGERSEEEEEMIILENKQVPSGGGVDGHSVQSSGTLYKNGTATTSTTTTTTSTTANKNIVKPKPAPRKRSTDLKVEAEHRQEHEILDVSHNRSWHLDNSWEFVNWEKGDEERLLSNGTSSQKFPVQSLQQDSSNNNTASDVRGERDYFSKSEDEANMNHPSMNLHRFSRYDNLESREIEGEGGCSVEDGDEMSDVGEEKISSPWDSSKWEHLLRIVSESTQQLDSIKLTENTAILDPKMNRNLFLPVREWGSRENKLITDSRQRISKILEVSGNVDKAGKAISCVVRDLAEKGTEFFGPTLKSFISCTIAAKSQDPFKVMRNTRQFISGMKNYLVGVSPESSELRNEIKRQTELLTDCEFLNIDAILEEVLVDLVISPLNIHIRGLLQIHHEKASEAAAKMTEGSQNQTPTYPFTFTFGNDSIKKDSYEKLKKIILGFEEYVSPIKKLDKWNEFVCQVQEMDNYSSESFLPLLSEVMTSVCSSSMSSHVDYMIGLLPHSLAEQNNYSISLLQSAAAALKSRKDRKGSSTLTSIRVIVPDERNGTLIRKMVPIRDTTTTKDVAKIVASKVGIANPGDYVLVRIKNGEEKLCPDGELVSKFLEDNATALAYKRVDAKIGWPLKIT